MPRWSLRQVVAAEVASGLPPLQVARNFDKPIGEVARMLLLQIASGDLSFADIVFSIDQSIRKKYDAFIDANQHVESKSDTKNRKRLLTRDERVQARLYQRCRDAVAGDYYLRLQRLEVHLHLLVRRALESQFPGHDDAWWRSGVPLETRVRCVQRREEDAEPLEAYAYTNLIDMKKIIQSNWKTFTRALHPILTHKRLVLHHLDRLNSIRNQVMHPTKLKRMDEDDYFFVKILCKNLQVPGA